MTNIEEVSKTTDEILQLNFELVEPLKNVYEKYKNNTIKELFDNVLDYQVNENTFPRYNDFSRALTNSVKRIHGDNKAQEIEAQLRKSTVIHTQVHHSLLRSFDARKRLNESNIAKPNEHYNTLVLQSEILWAAVSKNKNIKSISGNSGLISFVNETSPAYIQYGKSSDEAIRICNHAYNKSIVCTYKLDEERIIQVRKEIANIKDNNKKLKALKTFETICSTDKFTDGVSKAYSNQLNNLFTDNKNESIGLEFNEVLNEFFISCLENEESLTHYIFNNPEVTKFYYDSFSGIAMGWNKNQIKDKDGNDLPISAYDGFWELKDIKSDNNLAKKSRSTNAGFYENIETGEIQSFSANEIISKIRNEEIYPKNLHNVNLTFLEAGVLTIGGIAQAPYNTAVKKRIGNFIDNLIDKIEKEELPQLPKSITTENLQQRKNIITTMETEIPVAGFGILLGEKNHELASFNDFVESDRKLNEKDFDNILNTNVGDAIKAAALPIVEYKLGEKNYSKLVGDKVVSIPRTVINQESKEAIGKENATAISKLPMTREEYLAQKQNKFELYRNLKIEIQSDNDNEQQLVLAIQRRKIASR